MDIQQEYFTSTINLGNVSYRVNVLVLCEQGMNATGARTQ